MKKTIAAALLGATLLTGGAYAAQDDAQVRPPRPDQLTRADANNDGIVTREEVLTAADARFAQADTNKDGQLSAEERRAARPNGGRRGGAGMGDGGEMRARMLQRYDTDKDGKLSDAEREAMRAERGGRDRGDGGPARARADADGDGLVSLAEERAQAISMFDRTDTNKDGRTDAAERQAARDAMRAMRRGPGRDGDGPPPPPADAPDAPNGN
jgi:hypothetical protein